MPVVGRPATAQPKEMATTNAATNEREKTESHFANRSRISAMARGPSTDEIIPAL